MTAPLRPTTSGTAALRPTTSGALPGGTDGLSPRYNVIVFFIDDAAREGTSTYDNATWTGTPIPGWQANQWAAGTYPYAPEPEMQDLASNGLLLGRMHTAAMCSPSRGSLLTGRNNQQHTLGNAIQGNAVIDPATGEPYAYQGAAIYKLMEAQESPYERIHIGKWHITEIPTGSGTIVDSERICRAPVEVAGATLYEGHPGNFGELVGVGDQNKSNHEVYVWARHDVRDNARALPAGPDSPFSGNVTFDMFDGTGTHSLIRQVDTAKRAIQEARADGKPFLMHVWFNAVHSGLDWAGPRSMGGAALSGAGYHSYGASAPGGSIDASHATNIKAFWEATDTAIGAIRDELTVDEAARTMIVVCSDNGSQGAMLVPDAMADILEPGKDTVPAAPDNPYLYEGGQPQHGKRSPWEGGIAASCIIHGPGVADPGDGSAPRVWSGLAGIEDLFDLICHWTGTRHGGDVRYDTTVLRDACANTSAVGRTTYIQIAFQNGFADDPFSEDQGGAIRYVSAQNAAGYKLIWVRAGAESDPPTTPPTPAGLSATSSATWIWQLYDLTSDPVEKVDLYWDSGSFADPTDYEAHTVQDRYDALTSGQKTQFNELYRAIRDRGWIPPGMELVLA